ncbi:MAG TPA: alcohol dehydrogenase catalytic domain-containing protein [Candidatus Saccharimonadales bacterium]|nr:alcohol dehydrogenase catalytic domain-containing protein [Candidatus Saccharimonadales bacterium]
MRAVRLVEAHRLELVDIPAPEAMPGEVVIRVDGCGICGSDLTSYKVGLFTDAVPGHELAGVIDSVGDGVTGWAHGASAVVDPKLPCGACEDCRSGASYRCAMALTAGIGFARDGGFAEFVAVPAPLLHRLPAGIALEHACLVEPLSVAIHGVDRARLRPGEPVVVVGLGPIGLFTVATLHARGIGPIVGVDPVEDRRRLALDLGAATAVAELREVRGHIPPVPAVIECSGYAPLLHAAADLVAPGGRLVLVGVPFGEATVIPLMWVTREIEIIGSIASNADDFAVSLEMLTADPGIARVATRRASLAQVPEVFEELITPSSGGKVVVDPWL